MRWAPGRCAPCSGDLLRGPKRGQPDPGVQQSGEGEVILDGQPVFRKGALCPNVADSEGGVRARAGYLHDESAHLHDQSAHLHV